MGCTNFQAHKFSWQLRPQIRLLDGHFGQFRATRSMELLIPRPVILSVVLCYCNQYRTLSIYVLLVLLMYCVQWSYPIRPWYKLTALGTAYYLHLATLLISSTIVPTN